MVGSSANSAVKIFSDVSEEDEANGLGVKLSIINDPEPIFVDVCLMYDVLCTYLIIIS